KTGTARSRRSAAGLLPLVGRAILFKTLRPIGRQDTGLGMEAKTVSALKDWKLLLAILLSTGLVATPARAVITTSGTPATLPNEPEFEPEADRQAVSREIERFRSSSISLGQAMAIAEARHAGATTADVSFDGASGVPVYRVKTLHNDRVWRHTINAATGEL